MLNEIVQVSVLFWFNGVRVCLVNFGMQMKRS
jgi:hypothetical protein